MQQLHTKSTPTKLIRNGLALATLMLSTMVWAQNPYTEFHDQYESRYRDNHEYREVAVPSAGHYLHVREFGEREESPTFVLMHGFPDNIHLYDRLAPRMARFAHVISFDFLGWGHSDKPDNVSYNIQQQIADLEAVIDYFGLQKVVLVVHDMAGPPAIDWALGNASRLQGLVLLNTYYGPMQSLISPEAIDYYATLGENRDQILDYVQANDSVWFAGFLQQMSKFFVRKKNYDVFSRLFAALSLDIQPAFFELTRTLYNDVANNALKQATLLPQLQSKSAIIFGANDPYLNPGVAKAFHALLPNSELHLVENAGHFVQIDQPGKVSELIRNVFSADKKD